MRLHAAAAAKAAAETAKALGAKADVNVGKVPTLPKIPKKKASVDETTKPDESASVPTVPVSTDETVKPDESTKPVQTPLIALEADLSDEPEVVDPTIPLLTASPGHTSDEKMETDEPVDVPTAPATTATIPASVPATPVTIPAAPAATTGTEGGAEGAETTDDSEGFIDVSTATHQGKQKLLCQSKKDEKAKATAPDESDDQDDEPRPVYLRSRQLAMLMSTQGFPVGTTISQLQAHAKPRVPRKSDKDVREDKDDDPEIMDQYAKWYSELSDLSGWIGLRDRQGARHTFSQSNQRKLNTARDIWQPGQRCPFICCRIPRWNPDGVLSFKTKAQFLRHLCELHCPALYECACPVGTCPRVYDWRCEAIRHAGLTPHKMAKKQVLEKYSKNKGGQRPMRNLTYGQTLCLSSQDYVPAIKGGELKRKDPNPPPPPPAKKVKAKSPVPPPAPIPKTSAWDKTKTTESFPALPGTSVSTSVPPTPATATSATTAASLVSVPKARTPPVSPDRSRRRSSSRSRSSRKRSKSRS